MADMVPQPGPDGSVVYVPMDQSAAFMQQAWVGGGAEEPANGEEDVEAPTVEATEASAVVAAADEEAVEVGDGEVALESSEAVGAAVAAPVAPATLANATIAIAPPPSTYLMAAPKAEVPDAKAGRGRGRGPGSRGGKARNAQQRAMAMSGAPGAGPSSLQISGSPEAAALLNTLGSLKEGEAVPSLSRASAELQQSLLPGAGALPPTALAQGARAQGLNPESGAGAATDSQLLQQIAVSVTTAAAASSAAQATAVANSVAAAHAATLAASTITGPIKVAKEATIVARGEGSSSSGAVVVASPSVGGTDLPVAVALTSSSATAVAAPAADGAAVTVTATVNGGSPPAPKKRRSSSGGGGGGGGGSGGPPGGKTSARALLAQHKVKIPDDLSKLQPISTTRTKSGWVGVYPARKGRWQAQVNHRSIGGYGTAWEAGVAVAARLVVMARAEEQAEQAKARGEMVPAEVTAILSDENAAAAATVEATGVIEGTAEVVEATGAEVVEMADGDDPVIASASVAAPTQAESEEVEAVVVGGIEGEGDDDDDGRSKRQKTGEDEEAGADA